jgi:hypothetical protein
MPDIFIAEPKGEVVPKETKTTFEERAISKQKLFSDEESCRNLEILFIFFLPLKKIPTESLFGIRKKMKKSFFLSDALLSLI